MNEDSTVQLRRNPSKQMIARGHISRHGKGKGSSTRLHKHNLNMRKNSTLQRSLSSTSINQAQTHQSSAATPSAQSTEATQSQSRGSKTNRFKANAPIGVSSGNSYTTHRHRGLNSGLSSIGQSYRKSVIQLEREDDDDDEDTYDNNDFEDLEEDSDPDDSQSGKSSPDRSDHLNIGIQPVEPTPPKLSEETVVSVSSFADMASALKGARDKSGFVGSDDLISTAVNRSKNFGEMAQMVQGWNTTKRGSLTPNPNGLGTNRKVSGKNSRSNASPGDEDPREFEKVFREYTNTRVINNPVINSLYRLFKANESMPKSTNRPSPAFSVSSGNGGANTSTNTDQTSKKHSNRLQLRSGKKVNPLVATTANQMSDFSERGNFFPDKYSNSQNHGVIESVSTYTLNKMWQSGWIDTESDSKDATSFETTDSPSDGNGIHGQALRVQQQLANTRDRHNGPSAIKLS